MNSKGRQLHGSAEETRERGELLEALKLTDSATVEYLKANDLLGLAEVQASRFITFKHLFQQTGEKNYLTLGKLAAQAGVEIAEASGIPEALALPYFNLGKAHAEAGEWSEAVEAYLNAVKNFKQNPPEMHNRPAVLLDIKGHLHIAQFKVGDQTAIKKAEDVVKELEQTEELSDYNKKAWISGAYLRLAEASKSKKYLEKAKQVIDSDPRLKLRQGQWQKLAEII